VGLEGFTPLEISLVGDEAWSDLKGKEVLHGTMTHAAILDKGTHRGKPSVAVRGKTDDGKEVMLETTWALFYSAAHAFEARYGEPQ
jgi:hypothetical protein